MLSSSATALLLLSATILKPLWGENHYTSLPRTSKSGVADKGTSIIPTSPEVNMLLGFSHSPEDKANPGLPWKRQFGAWGGKKRSIPSSEDGFLHNKRQFSPWGGKRSPVNKSGLPGDEKLFKASSPHQLQVTTLSSEKKRNFNSWGGKRTTSNSEKNNIMISSKGKRSLSQGKERLAHWKNFLNSKEIKQWLREKDWLNYLDSKRTFGSWGGKRSFNSWGGKRSFNSWGGKRSFNSWGGKRSNSF